MKVVHLIAGLCKGGAETNLVNLIKYQSGSNEIEYTIISLGCFHYYEDEIRQLGCELIEVDIWNKPDFVESYICAVLLIIPSYFYLPMQIANTTTIVENKVKLTSIVYIIMGVINVCVSLIISKYFGAIGASLSIFIAYMVRNALMVCIHVKVLHLDMKTFFKNTFLKITPFLLVMLGIGLGLEYFNPMTNGFLRFAVNGVVFVVIFAILLYRFVVNDYEKNLFLGVFKKVLRKVKR